MINFKYQHPTLGDYSDELLKFHEKFYRYIKPNDWVIDIGCATGDTTLVMASLVGKMGKVIGFEPSKNIKLLFENIKLNPDICLFDLYNIGLYNKDCEVDFFNTPSLDNGGIVDAEFGDENRHTTCKATLVNGEKFLRKQYSEQDLSKIKFIKIDTEGLDSLIINNLKPIILKFKPVLFIEWWNDEKKNQEIFDAINNIEYIAHRSDNFLLATPEQFKCKSHDLILLPK